MNNQLLRATVAGLVALPVALALFIVMQALISEEFESPQIVAYPDFEVIPVPDEIKTKLEPIIPPEPLADPQEPPPQIIPAKLTHDSVDNFQGNIRPKMDGPKPIDGNSSLSEGEYLPIVKVQPVYPSRAQTGGIEGYCIVEFTVLPSGATGGARAVDCAPSGYFEKTSIRAAGKFKYKPRVMDGVAVKVAGVRNLFKFKLQDQ